MSSRIDPHFETVFAQLQVEGLSFRTVAKNLSAFGLKVSSQALHRWYLSRISKLKERSEFAGAVRPLSAVATGQDAMLRVESNDPLSHHLRAAEVADGKTFGAFITKRRCIAQI
jgi:hypothetical protein